jgi:hypothetical protein
MRLANFWLIPLDFRNFTLDFAKTLSTRTWRTAGVSYFQTVAGTLHSPKIPFASFCSFSFFFFLFYYISSIILLCRRCGYVRLIASIYAFGWRMLKGKITPLQNSLVINNLTFKYIRARVEFSGIIDPGNDIKKYSDWITKIPLCWANIGFQG